MTGTIQDLDIDGQAELAGEISKELVDVVKANGGTISVLEASREVSSRMGIGEAQVSYGVAFARITHALKLDAINYTLSLS